MQNCFFMKKTLLTLLSIGLLTGLAFPLTAQNNEQEDPTAPAKGERSKKHADKPEPPNPWTKPNTPPPIEPGNATKVSCPDPLTNHTSSTLKLDNTKESFSIYIPVGFDPKETYGVVVFIPGPNDRGTCPGQWFTVLNDRKLICISPYGAGNKEMLGRRYALALTSAELAKKYFKIDPKRIYVAGYSGGARVAGMLALNYPEVFKGTIQSCGADFYKPVPRVAVTDEEVAKGADYGGCQAGHPEEAKANVRFVFITGPGDFRNHFIKDIYNGGYKPSGFKALLIDVPDMRHNICNTESFGKAIDFIETGKLPE